MTPTIMALITMTSAIMFIQMSHPLAMGLVLLIQTAVICLLVGTSIMSKTFWFSYILLMIFLGGMLVLFIYVAALASNEMFSTSVKMMILMLTAMAATTMMIMVTDMHLMHPMSYNSEMMPMMNLKSFNPENSLMLIKLYNPPTNFTTIMLMSYLLITLIAVVKVTNVFEGPLRKIN